MFCHPNTVRQRLRRLETRTGRSVNNPRDATELFIALDISVDHQRPGEMVPFGVSSCA
jgi:DNA-binding PucR family transcriptional regulator